MKPAGTLVTLAVGAAALMTLWQFGTASGAQQGVTVYKARSITTGIDTSIAGGYVARWNYNGLGYQTLPVSSASQALTLAEQMIDAGQG